MRGWLRFHDVEVYLSGIVTGLAIIMAIGAQNAYILRQGIRREHIGAIIAVCLVSDVLLISAGTAGFGVLVERLPWLVDVMKWGGIGYLIWFAITSFRSAAKQESVNLSGDGKTLRTAVVTTLSLTFLNPQAYLDTIVLLGAVANQHGAERWDFAGGAMTASVIWFLGFGLGARALARPLNRASVWRSIDIGVGVIMLAIAGKLLFV